MASLLDDAPLSKAEQEEEEMRHELKEVGLYYENMGVEEMRQLIDVLNESKKDVRIQNEDTTDSMLFSDNRSSQDTSKITEISTRPLPSFSYRQEASSGTLSTHNSTLKETKSSDKNSHASSSNSFEKNLRDNSPDSEPIYDKNSNFKKDDDYPSLGSRYKTRSTTGDGPRTRSQDPKKPSVSTAKRATLERWNLNPFKFIEEKNTTPLCQPEETESNFEDEEPLPFNSAAIDLESDEFDRLCQQMTDKLETFSKRCLVELEAKNKKSAPIKIVIDGSASKVPVKENSFSISSPGPSTSASPSARNSYDRATKRKALSTIAAATTYENDENDSGDEFSNTKKRKFQQGKKEEEGVKRNQESKKNRNNNDKSTEVISLDDNKDMEFDHSNLHSIRKSVNTKASTDNVSNEQKSEYPRRIEPPNPAKKNFRGPRAKKKNANSTLIQTQSEPEKKQMFLNDEEIQKTLQEIDDQIDDGDCVEITEDIKPPPTPKRLTKRLQIASNHLETVRKLEEQKLKDEEEEKERREREERLKLDERYSSRLQEQENEEGRRLENQRKCNEQTDFYNNLLNAKSRVTRSTVQAKKTAEEINEDRLLEGDDDEPTITDIIQKQLCPICQKQFPADQIQRHASGCDAYAQDVNEFYNKPSTSRHVDIYKCRICDKFKTADGNLYEEHVSDCKNRPRHTMNGGWII